MTALELAELFHEIYERRAPEFGYETRTETRAFSPDTPNGQLMVAVCDEIISNTHELCVMAAAAMIKSGSAWHVSSVYKNELPSYSNPTPAAAGNKAISVTIEWLDVLEVDTIK